VEHLEDSQIIGTMLDSVIIGQLFLEKKSGEIMTDSFIKDPNSVEPFYVVWCSKDGTNDASTSDSGELQSATISTSDWTVPTGITEDSEGQAAVTIQGVTYAINTVATIWLSAGVAGTDYDLVNRITTSDSRTLDHTITIKVRET
jgi:hypothetical protein